MKLKFLSKLISLLTSAIFIGCLNNPFYSFAKNVKVESPKKAVIKNTNKDADVNKKEDLKKRKKNKSKDKKDKKDKKINTNETYCLLPLNVTANSKYDKIIALQAVYNALFEEKILDKDKFKALKEKEIKNIVLDDSILQSFLLNENFEDMLQFHVITKKEKEYLKNRLESEEFKKFIKNFKLTENKFEKAKKNILKTIKDYEKTLKENIKNFEEGNVKLLISHNLGSKKPSEQNEILYKEVIRHLIKKNYEKLYEKIEKKTNSEENKKIFFRKSFDKAVKIKIKSLKESLEKLINKKNGFIKEIEKIDFNDLKKVKIKSLKGLKEDDIVNSLINRGYIDGTQGYYSMCELDFDCLFSSYVDALQLTTDEKKELRELYEEKLDKLKNNVSLTDEEYKKELKEHKKNIINFMKKYDNNSNSKKLKSLDMSIDEETIEKFKEFKINNLKMLIEHLDTDIV